MSAKGKSWEKGCQQCQQCQQHGIFFLGGTWQPWMRLSQPRRRLSHPHFGHFRASVTTCQHFYYNGMQQIGGRIRIDHFRR